MVEQMWQEHVTDSLARIETTLENHTKEFEEMKPLVKEIPTIELGLNNHLRSHDNFKKYVMYPIFVSAIVASFGIFCKLILHIF